MACVPFDTRGTKYSSTKIFSDKIMFKPHQATRVTLNYICEQVCRRLTCKVHPKTPIMSIATHRYSEKTSHHGFRTRYLAFCSEPKFLNSPTGIILAAAPHWWKRGRTEDTEAKIGFQHTAVSGEPLDTGFKVVWHKKRRECTVILGFPTQSLQIPVLFNEWSVLSLLWVDPKWRN